MTSITQAQYLASLDARRRRRQLGVQTPAVHPRYGVGSHPVAGHRAPAPGLTPAKVAHMVRAMGIPVERFAGRARIWAERAAAGLAPAPTKPRRARRRRRSRRSLLGAVASALFGGRRRRRRLTGSRARAAIECPPGSDVAFDVWGNQYCRIPQEKTL